MATTAPYFIDATGNFIAVATDQGTKTIPRERWPGAVEEMGLGTWEDGRFTPVIPLPPHTVYRPLDRKGLLLGLLAAGITEADIHAAIASETDERLREIMRIEFTCSSSFNRHHPFVARLGAAAGLDSAQIDRLWQEAQGDG